MFYPELLSLSKDGKKILSDELIERIDSWLALLPDEIADKITVTRFSIKIGIDYRLSRTILERLCELNVLKRTYAILCPKCNHVLKITDELNLISDINKITYCYSCNEEDIILDSSNIEIRYKLIKHPNDPEKIKSICEDITGEEYSSEEDFIKALVEKSDYNSNKIFYNPTEEEYSKLKNLFRGVFAEHHNSTEKGNSLENLVIELLRMVKCFEANGARTSINQIDCMVRNKFSIPCNVLCQIGNIFYCECKNEKTKPDNTYFHKLNSILVLSQHGAKDRKFGIVFSIEKPTKNALDVAKMTFQYQNILMINISKNEIENIVFNHQNLLDIIEEKVNKITNDIITDLKDAGIY